MAVYAADRSRYRRRRNAEQPDARADDAARLRLQDHDSVEVRVDSNGRSLTFGDVIVRVSTEYRLEMHIDVDEANAAGLDPGASGEVLLPTSAVAHATKR